MTSKRANWLFLTIILVHFGVIAFLIFWGSLLPDSLVLSFFLSQSILIVPTIIFLLIFERRETAPVSRMRMPGTLPAYGMSRSQMPDVPPAYGMPRTRMPGAPTRFEAAAFHKVKISTLLMIMLCTFLIMPLVTVLNALTMFFTDNAVAALEGDIVSTSFLVMLFMIGIFGPFCEEFVFRGVIYRSYRRSGCTENSTRYGNARSNGISAMILSSLLFGLMHMNFNQAVYAFAIGIFLVLLVEAAGSLWASVFCHMFFNSCQVVLMYVSESLLNSAYGQAANETAEQLSAQDLLAALSIYLVIAAVTTPIAVCVIVWIAKNEGRQAAFSELFRRRDRRPVAENRQPLPYQMTQPPMQLNLQPQPSISPYQMPRQQSWQQWSQPQPPRAEYLLSVPLIIAIVLCLGYMSLELILLA
ncbi:CPBP family intramembrane metalloprotease [bacterium 1xD42-87]|nr:CPBP family intramembrane metalloprotease [bacterium 1xD42-87]